MKLGRRGLTHVSKGGILTNIGNAIREPSNDEITHLDLL
jgi:hypothetical protein